MARESALDVIRQTPHYKLGYLRGAVSIALEMLKHGAIKEAITRLEDSLIIVKGVEDGNSL